MIHLRAASAGLFLLAVVVAVAADPPVRTSIPVEEEEAAPKKREDLKKIELDDDLPDLAAASGAYYARLEDVVRAAGQAKNPGVKKVLGRFAVAFDLLVEAKGPPTRVTPVPKMWGREKFPDEFGVVPLDADNRPQPVRTLTLESKAVRRIEPFEMLAVGEMDRLANPPPSAPGSAPEEARAPAGERLAAAERVLADVLAFHDRARELDRRKGKGWDHVRQTVADRLTDVRVARIRQAAGDKDWATVRALGARLADRFQAEPKLLEVVFAARLAEAEEAVKSDRPADLERVRQLLVEYEARFPNAPKDVPQRMRAAITERAKKLFGEAERKAFQNPTEARNLLKTVEALDPDLAGLREKQQELRTGYAMLYVGARRMPERMSPAAARFDSERQAAELMFEGLLEPVPDDVAGVRYRPALAADRPLVAAGVRDVPLVGSAAWAGPDKAFADFTDLTDTVKLLRNRPGSWAADPVAWLDDPTVDPADPGRVRMRLRQGHPDPRELLTFKVLPGRWLTAKGKQIDDLEFARRPFGTGPFRLAPGYRPPVPGDAPPKEVAFVSNPGYGSRPGKFGQPYVKEVRFVDLAALGDPAAAFAAEKLHVLPDVPTADLPKFTANNALTGRVRVATAASSRRVHILAVNHRRPPLRSVDLRRGLTHAIDREAILDGVFRAGNADFHRAMTGPFPPGTWAVPKPLGVAPGPLFDRDLGAAKLKAYRAAGGASELGLAFPADDPPSRQACEKLKANIDAADAGVTLVLEPLPAAELDRRVRDEQRFDLAYLPFDYPDDWFPLGLGSLLDPAAADPGGRNYLGYRAAGVPATAADGQLGDVLGRCRQTRDPARLAPLAHEAHKRFNETVPFVPLWHLDRHTVLSTAVKVYLDGRPEEANPRWLDPTTLFTSVGRWRVE